MRREQLNILTPSPRAHKVDFPAAAAAAVFMAASEQQQTWKLHGPVSDSDAFASSPTENPLDWTCEELKGRATALFFPLSDGEILVREGTCVAFPPSRSSCVSVFVAGWTFLAAVFGCVLLAISSVQLHLGTYNRFLELS